MFTYAHFTKDGGNHLQAFNKSDKAVDFAYKQISDYISYEEKQYGAQVPIELIAVKKMLEELKNNKTLERVKNLIELYEEYCRHVLGQESPLHILNEIQLVE